MQQLLFDIGNLALDRGRRLLFTAQKNLDQPEEEVGVQIEDGRASLGCGPIKIRRRINS